MKRKKNSSRLVIKLIAAAFVLLSFLVLTVGDINLAVAQEAKNSDLRVYVDGVKVNFPDQQPYIDSNSRTLVPVRFVSEALGAKVDWEGSSQRVTVTDDEFKREIFLWVGSQDYEINGIKKQMDTEADLTGQGRVMVPLRFVSEGLGSFIDYRSVEKVGLVFNFNHNFQEEEIAKTIDMIVQEVKSELDASEPAPTAPIKDYVSEIDLASLALTTYREDMQINPEGNLVALSGFDFDTKTFELTSKIVLADLIKGTAEVLIEGEDLKIINWSPDGSSILYLAMESLMLYHLETGISEKVEENAYYGAFSDDGLKIAYTKRNDGLYVYNITNGERNKISNENDANGPLWYSDNQTIFYFTDLGIALGDGAGYKQGLAKINTITKEKEILIPQESGKYRKSFWMIPDKVLYIQAGWDDGFFDKIVDLEQGEVIDIGENDSMRQYSLAVGPHGKLLKVKGINVFYLDRTGSIVETIELNKLNDFVLGGSAYTNQILWLDDNHLVTIINAPVQDSPFLIKVFSIDKQDDGFIQ